MMHSALAEQTDEPPHHTDVAAPRRSAGSVVDPQRRQSDDFFRSITRLQFAVLLAVPVGILIFAALTFTVFWWITWILLAVAGITVTVVLGIAWLIKRWRRRSSD
jgi:membrane protein YdbS with pleckstrin-like domain